MTRDDRSDPPPPADVQIMSDVQLTSVSFVKFRDEDIREVARITGRDEQNVREFLAGKRADPVLYHTFHYVTGVYPISHHSTE